tara:strand:- start:7189 stop:7710 length:522 start_codon:yes stop_codon:yes gene_type:complete
MSEYFQYFPDISYDVLKDGGKQIAVNVTLRARIREIIERSTAVYYTYNVNGDERPDTVAYNYYGDSRYDWLVLYSNNIIDPYYDWPLGYEEFKRYIIKKYNSISSAKSTIHAYQNAGGFNVDLTTYNSLTAANRSTVDAYTYEYDLNESKREIVLLDRVYLRQVLDEIETIFT